MRTIKLAHGVDRGDRDDIKDYKVLVVKNSTEYHPGQILQKIEVSDLCAATHWDVTIVSYEEGRK